MQPFCPATDGGFAFGPFLIMAATAFWTWLTVTFWPTVCSEARWFSESAFVSQNLSQTRFPVYWALFLATCALFFYAVYRLTLVLISVSISFVGSAWRLAVRSSTYASNRFAAFMRRCASVTAASGVSDSQSAKMWYAINPLDPFVMQVATDDAGQVCNGPYKADVFFAIKKDGASTHIGRGTAVKSRWLLTSLYEIVTNHHVLADLAAYALDGAEVILSSDHRAIVVTDMVVAWAKKDAAASAGRSGIKKRLDLTTLKINDGIVTELQVSPVVYGRVPNNGGRVLFRPRSMLSSGDPTHFRACGATPTGNYIRLGGLTVKGDSGMGIYVAIGNGSNKKYALVGCHNGGYELAKINVAVMTIVIKEARRFRALKTAVAGAFQAHTTTIDYSMYEVSDIESDTSSFFADDDETYELDGKKIVIVASRGVDEEARSRQDDEDLDEYVAEQTYEHYEQSEDVWNQGEYGSYAGLTRHTAGELPDFMVQFKAAKDEMRAIADRAAHRAKEFEEERKLVLDMIQSERAKADRAKLEAKVMEDDYKKRIAAQKAEIAAIQAELKRNAEIMTELKKHISLQNDANRAAKEAERVEREANKAALLLSTKPAALLGSMLTERGPAVAAETPVPALQATTETPDVYTVNTPYGSPETSPRVLRREAGQEPFTKQTAQPPKPKKQPVEGLQGTAAQAVMAEEVKRLKTAAYQAANKSLLKGETEAERLVRQDGAAAAFAAYHKAMKGLKDAVARGVAARQKESLPHPNGSTASPEAI